MSLADNKRIYTTIKSRIETEKSYRAFENSTVTFLISNNASKIDVKFAINKLYPELEVINIRTILRKGKVKRTRKGFTKRSDKKYAFVKLSGQIEKLSDLRVNIKGETNV